MLNPISEMKSEITTAKILQAELHNTIKQKRESVKQFYAAKEKAEEAIKPEPPKATIEPPPVAKYRVIADEEKEQALLKMAKAEYESYDDVAKFAKALNLHAGVVYLTLKHHGFIKQNETTQYRVLDSYYRNNGNLKAIVADVGLNVWLCAKTIEQLGLSPNWQSYKEDKVETNLGDWAEEQFRQLVGNALDMNRYYQASNPNYDFVINGKTVDVKGSTLKTGSEENARSPQYAFRIKSDNPPDFYCVFLIKEKDKPYSLDNCHILLFPKEILPNNRKGVYIAQKSDTSTALSQMYWDFEVEPAALATMLEHI
ncbi:riboflavin synthase subunit alpha [Mannheimia indoligenes]|uniref:riboflavin synthase subunit alpha n=1 Tax=Mannheimia indoligenes TaxID=3103145 RepID=UPI002FE5A5D3